MVSRLWRCAASFFLLLACGCDPRSEANVDEQKNPYFLAGKERVAAHDYEGAIEAFEKALEINPKSVLAHFEVAVLYEQHSEQKDSDYIAAMYHYQQVLRLRPNEYPADNARQRIAGCKQELVKGEALAPVAQSLIRENDRLKQENRTLQQQLESLRVETARVNPMPPPAGFAARTNSSPRSRTNSVTTIALRQPSPATATLPSPTSGSAKSHTVRQGDTAYAIARQYKVSLGSLLAANPGVDPKHMRPGQILNIPAS
jgi:tetratricopeptide (TPR) repeat protein